VIVHYNSGDKEMLIKDVIHILVVGNGEPVTVLLANGREYTISLDHIEAIVDDSIVEDKSNGRKSIRP